MRPPQVFIESHGQRKSLSFQRSQEQGINIYLKLHICLQKKSQIS